MNRTPCVLFCPEYHMYSLYYAPVHRRYCLSTLKSPTIKDMSLRTKCGDQFLLSVPQPSWYLVLFQLCRYNDLSSESTQWGLCKGFETLQAFLRTLCCNCYFSCPLGRVTTKKKGVFWFAWLVIKYHKNSLLKKCILSTPNECSCVVFEY